MRILMLATDAFGGIGGIAQHNRDLLGALCAMPEVEEVVAVPRNIRFPAGDLPAKLRFHAEAAGGKLRFIGRALAVSRGRYDLVVCGHINLLPVAALLSRKARAPLVLQVYGIDAWQPHPSALVRRLVRQVDSVWAISGFTRDRLLEWSGVAPRKVTVFPTAIDLDRFTPGPKNAALVRRLGLEGRKVLMVLCRLAGAEKVEAVRKVLELMPRLLLHEPGLSFLIVGDGEDRAGLEERAKTLAVGDRVVFAGLVPDSEKTDYYRLADAFAMPGRGEGFGIVYLEALACGVPVVASLADGSREAVRDGLLGRLAHPDDPAKLEAAILAALKDARVVPDGLGYFSLPNFQRRVAAATRRAVPLGSSPYATSPS